MKTIHSYSLESLKNHQPCCWINTNGIEATNSAELLKHHLDSLPLVSTHLNQASERWSRLRPVLSSLFPSETPDGVIQSPLRPTSAALQESLGLPSSCTLYIKEDSKLAVCGSVKARGGLYETFSFAETINNDWTLDEESKIPLIEAIREGLMEDYSVVVGSTGNLGLSVGLAASSMGMKSTIHMSNDAKLWKKKLLRQRGSVVLEHEGSYGLAVEEGRKASLLNEKSHFIDDEASKTLFLGYSAAALELEQQLKLNEGQKLVVYLPCGVGGAPSGICWGLKHVFGTRVTVLFAEPTHAPCVLVALGHATQDKEWGKNGETKTDGKESPSKNIVSCFDLGLDVITEADGLACGTASPLCCQMVHQLCDGIYTVDDRTLFARLAQLISSEGEDSFMEPSSCAALDGPRHLVWLAKNGNEKEKLFAQSLLQNCIHIVWATGGALVPEDEREKFIERGKRIFEEEEEEGEEEEY